MANETKAKYLAESEEKLRELKKMYEDFSQEYSLIWNSDSFAQAIVEERGKSEGIEIYPKIEVGWITNIKELKPKSELEIKLIGNDFGSSRLFKSEKGYSICVIYYKPQDHLIKGNTNLF